MKIKSLTDYEYRKGMIYLEEHEHNPLRETDRHFRKRYNMVEYIIDLHDDRKFPLYLSCAFEYIRIATGMQLIRDLPNL